MERAGRLIGTLKITKDLGDPELRARAAWNVAAGKKIAEHTRVAALVRTTLVVEVEDQVWQRQLNTLRHFLLRNLRTTLGEALISEIDFRPMPDIFKVPRRGVQRATASRSANGIQDPVLDALYSKSKRSVGA